MRAERKHEEWEDAKTAALVKASEERQAALKKEFEDKWKEYAREKRQHQMERNNFKLDLIGSEMRTEVQKAEYEKLPKIHDEINLYIPLDDQNDELMMKTSKNVTVDSGSFKKKVEVAKQITPEIKPVVTADSLGGWMEELVPDGSAGGSAGGSWVEEIVPVDYQATPEERHMQQVRDNLNGIYNSQG